MYLEFGFNTVTKIIICMTSSCGTQNNSRNWTHCLQVSAFRSYWSWTLSSFKLFTCACIIRMVGGYSRGGGGGGASAPPPPK